MLEEPYPELDDLLTMLGEAGRRLAEIEASEGAAGNISVCMRWPVEPRTRFPVVDEIELPQLVPELENATSWSAALAGGCEKSKTSQPPTSLASSSTGVGALESSTPPITAALSG